MIRLRHTVVAMALLSLRCSAQLPAGVAADAHIGKADAVIARLQPIKSAEAQSLLCDVYASIEQRDRAIDACQAAVNLAPGNSDYALSLARAFGAKADHSGAFTGMRMVGKIRTNFERAVELNPKSVDALSDLGQFYVEAPGIVGGGVDKAAPFVDRLRPLSPARSHRLAAMIAAKSKDDAKAEFEYKAELAVAHSPEANVDLANFYKARKQFDSAEDAAKSAIRVDKAHGPDALDAASLLLEIQRSVPVAQAAIRAYLSSPQAGVAAYARAHTLLGRSLLAGGNSAAAQAEFAAALALAKDYEPARKAAGK